MIFKRTTVWESQMSSSLILWEEAMKAMLAGNAVMFVSGYEKAIKIGSKRLSGYGSDEGGV